MNPCSLNHTALHSSHQKSILFESSSQENDIHWLAELGWEEVKVSIICCLASPYVSKHLCHLRAFCLQRWTQQLHLCAAFSLWTMIDRSD